MSESDVTIDYYEGVKWDLDQTWIVLTLRIVASPADQTLIDLLVEYDDSQHELRHSIIAHQQICTQGAFLSLVDPIDCAGCLYQAVYEHLRIGAT